MILSSIKVSRIGGFFTLCVALVCGSTDFSQAKDIIVEDASKAPLNWEPGVPFVTMMNCAPRAVTLYVALRGRDDTGVEMQSNNQRRFMARVSVDDASKVEFTARFEGDDLQRAVILKPGIHYRIVDRSRNGNYAVEPLGMPAMACQQR